jgi:Type II CAAX prenyl endopeptidase Rce1-like
VLVGMLLLWLVYTVLYTLPIPDVLAALAHLLPGIAAIAFLRASGFSLNQCNLVHRRLSAKGIGVLALVTLALAGPTLTSSYVGFSPLAVFLLAPASALAQELYFRAGLLPALHRSLPGRPAAANLAHAALFALWHVPKALIYSPINPLVGALILAIVTGVAGFGWGWQVRHDGTISWSTLHHWLLLSVMSLFGV